METTIIRGHQYGDSGVYIGPYDFPNNEDKEGIHLPPRTVLVAPPENLNVDEEAAWDGIKWIKRRIEMGHLPDREISL